MAEKVAVEAEAVAVLGSGAKCQPGEWDNGRYAPRDLGSPAVRMAQCGAQVDTPTAHHEPLDDSPKRKQYIKSNP